MSRHPRSKTTEYFMKKITNNGQDPEQAINCYLKSYRFTPHPALQTSPATVMF